MPPPCSSGFGDLPSTPAPGRQHGPGMSLPERSEKKTKLGTTEFCENSFQTWLHSQVLWNFSTQTGHRIFLTPQATPATFILPSHLIIRRLATQLPVAFLEMSWLFSFPWGLALCSMLIFSKLCWLITVFLSILFLKWPLHSLGQPGHQAVEWKLEQLTVKALSWKINK